MYIFRMMVRWALMVLSMVIFAGTLYGESMWGWVALYWMVSSIRWMAK